MAWAAKAACAASPLGAGDRVKACASHASCGSRRLVLSKISKLQVEVRDSSAASAGACKTLSRSAASSAVGKAKGRTRVS
ncbi:hypothetical protein D3C72_2195350 [compost metagenome]